MVDGGPTFTRHIRALRQAPALRVEESTVTYKELSGLADSVSEAIGQSRRLILCVMHNNLFSTVGYLSGLMSGHVVMAVPAESSDKIEQWRAQFDPDVVIDDDIEIIRDESAHTLHPDLALLLTTSGSTGAAKMVRLSREALDANAKSISRFLPIQESDRAMLQLPLSYSYGLSVLHSNLLVGSEIVLTDWSVLDDAFWQLAEKSHITSLHGVPYTFDLIERHHLIDLLPASLRYITQAGGKMAPEKVRVWAEAAQRSGWQFHVMYGQTEATARIAHLPPDLALKHPRAIGVAIPGGELRIDSTDATDSKSGIGELVYRGQNVMMGYASGSQDLAGGPSLTELRTGDLGTINEDGLFEVVGRKSRFVKVQGQRIDLEQVEKYLEGEGIPSAFVTKDDALSGVAISASIKEVRRKVAAFCRLAPSSIHLVEVAEIAHLANGKPNYSLISELLDVDSAAVGSSVVLEQLIATYAEVLGLEVEQVDTSESFASLGGDSLSYVEASIRVERTLGSLPDQWNLESIAGLARSSAEPDASTLTHSQFRTSGLKTRMSEVEVSLLLRAIAIVFIVGTHTGLFDLTGGAHLLLVVAGWNFARFHLVAEGQARRVRSIARNFVSISIPSAVWIGSLVLGKLFAISIGGGDALRFLTTISFHAYWFIGALLSALAFSGALIKVRRLDSMERRFPLGFAVTVFLAALIFRYNIFGLVGYLNLDPVYAWPCVFWLFALGWLIQRVQSTRQSLFVSLLTVLTLLGYFPSDLSRSLIVILGVLLLIWVRRVHLPAFLVSAIGVLASSSLYIYLTHFSILDLLQSGDAAVRFALSLGLGILTWRLWQPIARRISAHFAPVPERGNLAIAEHRL